MLKHLTRAGVRPGKRMAVPRSAGRRAAGGGPSGRRSAALMLAAALGFALAACGGVPVAPTTWLRLPDVTRGATAAEPAAGRPAAGASASRDTWQLAQPIALPAHLDRDSVFVPQGAAGAWVRPLAAARWIEPLRDAVPRLLREDVMRHAPGAVLWTAPFPPGLVPTRQLRVEITAFEVSGDGKALLTAARWSLADASGAQPPAVHAVRFETAPTGADAEAWALAHRQAVAALAQRIAATMTAP
ncbi:MAG: membrane integrity-associated transporter subunit PqiC [Rubrivivax sp.]|nr:membrane integrity-associated transporter subunit PqiC [Rubrivivax sp.]